MFTFKCFATQLGNISSATECEVFSLFIYYSLPCQYRWGMIFSLIVSWLGHYFLLSDVNPVFTYMLIAEDNVFWSFCFFIFYCIFGMGCKCSLSLMCLSIVDLSECQASRDSLVVYIRSLFSRKRKSSKKQILALHELYCFIGTYGLNRDNNPSMLIYKVSLLIE